MTDIIIFVIEIIGTIAFAASGAMLAIEKNMDVFGVCVLGVVTAVGGGMTRDVILGNIPSSLTDPIYITTAAIVSVVIFIIVYINKSLLRGGHKAYDFVISVMDAIGLGIFTITGITVGINEGHGNEIFLIVFLGVITGVGGGLIRDIMARQKPYILHKDIYASTSIVGAVLYIILLNTAGETTALLISPITVFVLRMLSTRDKCNLPKVINNRRK